MAEKFVINGGKPLKGEIEVRGAKNAAFPLLCACLLTQEDCLLRNVPLVEDVFCMLEILESMGCEIVWQGQRTVKLNSRNLDIKALNKALITRLRGSVLLYGPLLARLGKITLPAPGGCLIGSRPIETHLDAFSQLGVNIQSSQNSYCLELKKRPSKGLLCILNEFSVTATENIMLFAAFLPTETVIQIADQDYQVQELGRVLRKMGAQIQGLGTRTIRIIGQRKLKGFSHSLLSDPVETGTFIATVLATKGSVLIKNAELSFLTLFLKRLTDFGAKLEIPGKDKIKVSPSKRLKMDVIQSMPYPGIHSDLQPELGVLATQSQGPTLIHDPLYEGRLKYLEELNRMGAKIVFCDYHRALIYGPTPLYGIEVLGTDIRAGAALITAGLVAKGQTIIHNAYQVDRGYERIEERLQGLGADIRRVKD